jgi:hypothetical protein
MRLLIISMVLLLLTACPGGAVISPPQEWEGMNFRVETRPPVIEPGMVEFLVMGDRDRKRAHDLIVNIRIGAAGRWTQSIQDGHVGVYRRALRVSDPRTDELQVHIRYEDKETVLVFPLDFAAGEALQ